MKVFVVNTSISSIQWVVDGTIPYCVLSIPGSVWRMDTWMELQVCSSGRSLLMAGGMELNGL